MQRVIVAEELVTFYHHIADVPGVRSIMAAFLRFAIASGGQRPTILLAARWLDYNAKGRIIRLVEEGGPKYASCRCLSALWACSEWFGGPPKDEAGSGP
jgi:hypothetical protein